MNKQASALAAAITATLGSTAYAASVPATLKSVASFSGNGSSAGNITSSTATFSYDDVTSVLSATGGTFNVRFSIVPSTTLFRHSIVGLVIGNNAAATATDYSCGEGNFGAGVGASLCGNYNFGVNFTNESTVTWGPGTTTARTVGGDDMTLGAQQSLLAYNSFTTVSWVGTTLTLSNAFCNPAAPGNANSCATTGGSNAGYTWVLEAVPPVPSANADTANARPNVATDIDVLANDDNLSDPVTVTADVTGTNPDANADIAVNGSGGPASGVTISYTPRPAAGTPTLTDTFTYTVNGLTATVTVTVANSAPSAESAPGVTISTQGVAPDTTSGTFTAPGTGGSLGDAPSIVSVITPATKGTAAVSGNTITYTTGSTFFSGTDTFEYEIEDDDGETSTATVTVTIADLTPALAGSSATTAPGEPVDFDLTTGLTAGNGSLAQHSFAVTTDGESGTCTISGTTLTYTPNADATGGDRCTVTITDGDGSTSTGTYSVEIGSSESSDGLRNGDGGSSADWLILSLLGGTALVRRRRKH